MIRHNAPAEKFDAAELGNAPHHPDEIIALIVFHKEYSMRDTADKMMNRIRLLKSIIRNAHAEIISQSMSQM